MRGWNKLHCIEETLDCVNHRNPYITDYSSTLTAHSTSWLSHYKETVDLYESKYRDAIFASRRNGGCQDVSSESYVFCYALVIWLVRRAVARLLVTCYRTLLHPLLGQRPPNSISSLKRRKRRSTKRANTFPRKKQFADNYQSFKASQKARKHKRSRQNLASIFRKDTTLITSSLLGHERVDHQADKKS